MKRTDIARLYRRHTRHGHAALPQVDALLALADGETQSGNQRTVDDIGNFGLHADLLRFARELAPESARLGVQLEQAFDGRGATHRGDRRDTRATPRRSWLRIASAAAAGLVVAVSVWVGRDNARPGADMASAAPRQDRIFAATDGKAPAARGGDEIFRDAFKPDRIFSSTSGG